MNVYDFDKTIYAGDSAAHFWLYLVRRRPAVLPEGAGAVPEAVRMLTGDGDRGRLKEKMFSVLRRVPDPAAEVASFWDSHLARIYPWYLDRRREDDVVVSASPEFLVGEACRRLGIVCIATKMQMTTGILEGPNCRGAEKIPRFRELYPDGAVEEFYSDSLSDRPMMELAEAGYLVKNGRVVRRVTGRGER